MAKYRLSQRQAIFLLALLMAVWCGSSCRADWRHWLIGMRAVACSNVHAPDWLVFPASLILLDLVLYWHHRLFHEIPFLWRWHGAHHSDRTFNVTPACAFIRARRSSAQVLKQPPCCLSKAPALAVICFEILLNGASLFNHANWRLGRVDGWLQNSLSRPICIACIIHAHHKKAA